LCSDFGGLQRFITELLEVSIELVVLVGCSLLISVWSVFSCRHFLLVWNGWVRQWCFSAEDFSIVLHSVFYVLFRFYVRVGVGR
jgi:hypothetical protein